MRALGGQGGPHSSATDNNKNVVTKSIIMIIEDPSQGKKKEKRGVDLYVKRG